jgi:MFS family permease
VLADRLNRRRLLIITQVFSMVQAFTLAWIVLAEGVRVWHIVVLSIILGVVNAVDMPVRHSFTVEMIEDRKDLGNAIALNSSLFNAARLIGPTLAGILISAFGEGICFLINGASYLAVIAALTMMQVQPVSARAGNAPMLMELGEGFAYAWNNGPIRSVLLLVVLVSLAGLPYTVLLPVIASRILHGGAQTYGFLLTSSGIGAFAATIYLATRRGTAGLCRIISVAIAIFSLGLASLALSRTIWLSILFLFVTGFGVITQLASSNTILQTVVDEDKRGRVMSLYTMALMGIAPLGSLLAGALAGSFGVRATLLAGSAACLAGAFLFMRRHGKAALASPLSVNSRPARPDGS